MGVITPGVTPSDAWANSSTKPLSVAESSSRPVSGHPSLPFRDEEALFWPQYPLDELLMEQGYCAEFLSENPNPPFAAKSEGGGGGGGSEPPADDYNYSSGGIARYSPLLPPASVDPYGKARALVRERSTPPPFDHPAWPHRGGGGVHNFSLFSSPVAEARASLQNMATLNKGMLGKKEVGGGGGEPLGNTTREASAGSPLPTTQPWFGSRKSSNRPAVEADSSKGKKPQRDNRTNSTVTGSAVTATDGETEAFEAQEQTRTRTRTQTRSRDSTDESTEESGKEAASSLKRKKSQGDESEYQSEDLEDAATLTVKPSTGRTKRRRAAEIHNESERRRRDRINEKMKALQALVPNANKTDKASMLDEAIEYLKLLQAQVQMMSMRTGMSMPPMMMTMGMPHLHHPQQVPPLTQMGVGMGMGMMDASSGHGMVPTLANPVQPFRGPGYPVNIFRPAMPMNTNECQYYLQTPGAVEPYGAFVASQQFQSANANMHMYNAVLQQQHMLQLQNNHIQAQQSVGNNPGNASTKEGP